jgi:hypothetical protein
VCGEVCAAHRLDQSAFWSQKIFLPVLGWTRVCCLQYQPPNLDRAMEVLCLGQMGGWQLPLPLPAGGCPAVVWWGVAPVLVRCVSAPWT